MNLIEQLGGYEKSKDVFSKMHHSCGRGYIEGKAVFYSYIGLQSALLEHRRANNIFEVGDWVVETSRHTDNQIYKIKEDHGEHYFYVGTNGGDRDFWTLFLGEIRHAIPEEIKAGKRL